MCPFMNLAIVGVLKHRFLTGKKALHRLFPEEFEQNLPTIGGGQGPEVPPVMPALAATFVSLGQPNDACDMVNSPLPQVYAVLSSEIDHSWKWEYDRFGKIYQGHLALSSRNLYLKWENTESEIKEVR
jgi:hypothetical protein